MLRINPDNNCIIQKLDCDGIWQPWLDITRCVQSTTFDLNINLGGINFGTGQPAHTECHDYDIIHEGNAVSLIPTSVSSGDTLTFSNWRGAVTDGFSEIFVIPPAWFCASGQGYSLNECHDDPGPAEVADPFQDFAHMRAILVINGVGYDAYNTTVTVPDGIDNQQAYVVLNDHTLGDNAGTQQYHVKVCKVGVGGDGSWIKTFDFRTDDGNFVSYDATGFGGRWLAGNGWGPNNTVDSHTNSNVWIRLELPGSAHFIFYHLELDVRDIDYTGHPGDHGFNVEFDGWSDITTQQVHNTVMTVEGTISRDATDVDVVAASYTVGNVLTQEVFVRKLILQGTGPEPTWP